MCIPLDLVSESYSLAIVRIDILEKTFSELEYDTLQIQVTNLTTQ